MLRNALGGLLPSTSRSVISEKLQHTKVSIIGMADYGQRGRRRQAEGRKNKKPLMSVQRTIRCVHWRRRCGRIVRRRWTHPCAWKASMQSSKSSEARSGVLAWLQYLRLARIAIVFLRGHSGVSHLCRRQRSQKKPELRELESAEECATGPL